jgi:hypothetical protein
MQLIVVSAHGVVFGVTAPEVVGMLCFLGDFLVGGQWKVLGPIPEDVGLAWFLYVWSVVGGGRPANFFLLIGVAVGESAKI